MIRRPLPVPVRIVVVALLAVGSSSRPAHGALPAPGTCAPPRTLVALLPLADQTDRTWESWTGESPARWVERLVADSLERGLGRSVLRLALAPGSAALAASCRPVDDDQALRVARAAKSEIAITGTVSVFMHDDHRESGRLGRWGMGAPDTRSRAQVRVTLRVLDVADGSVIIETTAARDRISRGTASASRPERTPDGFAPDALVEQVLREVLADLSRTIGQRLDARWQARVILEGPDDYVLDAGAARGLFMGERLEVWRSGIEVYDENLTHVGNDTRVGALVIVGLVGQERARARLAEGEARRGDAVRPCSDNSGPVLSMRH